MARMKKFVAVSFGGLIALVLVGMFIAAVTGSSPDEISSMNFIEEWTWYRVGLFVAVVASWPVIARHATRVPRSEDVTGIAWVELQEKHRQDYLNMRSQWWKIALLLAFVEIVLIQQFGLGG